MQKERLSNFSVTITKFDNQFMYGKITQASRQKLMAKQAQLMELLNLNYIRLYQFVKIPDYYIIVTKK
jgi:hypothetical protein